MTINRKTIIARGRCGTGRTTRERESPQFALRHIFATLAMGVLLAGCVTTPALMVQNDPAQRAGGERYDLRLTFIDHDELVSRYGSRDNLFIAPSATLMPERFIPFDLEVTAKGEPITIALNQIEIDYGGRSIAPTNQFHFGLYWENRDTESGVSGAEISSRQRTIRRTLLANQVRIAPGETAGGMLLFRGNFPQFGTAVVTMAVLDRNDRPVERARLTFEF